MKDYTVIALAYDDHIRIYASTTKHLVDLSRKYHHTLATSTAAMGRFLTAAGMMSYMYKDGERVTFKIEVMDPLVKCLLKLKLAM